ncbi:MAG: molybdopterin molybdotransferase MoeA [Candidatus Methanoperedens sp.]|nr:molybdopterin molybdotransferase MoeA [Candidatus Methanoperedens sp.]
MFRKITNADQAKDFFLKAIRPIEGTELINIENCDGRIVAEDIYSQVDVPHYRRAAMDGFAVRAADTMGANSSSPVLLRSDKDNEKGMCTRVHTGSLVPDWADAVIMIEDTVVHGETVEVFTQVHPFKNVGETGEDIRKGELIIQKGHVIRPCDVAVLASVRIDKINVIRKPVVAIIPTGEEVVPRGGRYPEAGEVYETNGLMTFLYVKKWGAVPHLLDIVTDDPEKIKEAIQRVTGADMIIISGGTSVGKRDHVPAVVESLGTLLVHGVGISPGKPTALGLVNLKPVVCMPGYPVAGMVALYYFARPAVRKLAHIPDEPDRAVRAVLSEKIPGRIGYKTFARVKLETGAGVNTRHISKAVPLATSGAGILSSVSKADGFVIIPENVEGISKGEEVEVVLIE